MLYKKINLKDEYSNLENDAFLTILVPDNYVEIDIERRKPGILVFPGGGYEWCSDREAEPIALRFLGYDINTFVLKYSVAPKTQFPYPMIEGLAAIDYIRNHSREFNIDEKQLYVMGFSAGGHLAASVAAHFREPQFKEYLGLESPKFDVNGCILGYPVITTDPSFAHLGSANHIIEKDPDKLRDYFAIEKNVTKDFPRTFVYSFYEDGCVPIKNSLELIDQLKKNGVEVESHIYHGAIHGSSLGDRSVYPDAFDIGFLKESTEWPLLAIDFIRRNK